MAAPRLGWLAALAIAGCGAFSGGCSGLLDGGDGWPDPGNVSGLHEGEVCDPASWGDFCASPFVCCKSLAAGDTYLFHCVPRADCAPAPLNHACDVDEGCETPLVCRGNRCQCSPCPCGIRPDGGRCCPGACADGGCIPGSLPTGSFFPGCYLPEGYRCSSGAGCDLSLTCCHRTSDWDAGPVCVASESECAQVGLGEPCVMDRDCVQPLWCSRDCGLCSRSPTGCAAPPLEDGGVDALDAAAEDGAADAGAD